RQDIQIHFVSLDRTPELWSKLDEDDITIREACGNTVRNVTSSPVAGIDPREPFDVSPYAHAAFEYFLRNPICQEMGRKFKIGFSSSEEDTAFSYIHDVGFIPKVRFEGEREIRGFKVVLGGGLGAQPAIASVVHEFLHEDLIIPFTESVIRVFDRYGERNNRNKARMKFLIAKMGLEEVLRLVEDERVANRFKEYKIDRDAISQPEAPAPAAFPTVTPVDETRYRDWLVTNVFEQKQTGFFGIYVKVPVGDIPTEKARRFIDSIRGLVAEEIRVTQNQGLLLKFARKESLPLLYNRLKELGLADAGFDSVADVTTCPGTDTCNLGISNSTELARVLEELVYEEYPNLLFNKDIKIKISGCMNSCGQHGLAHIGFHGSSLKANGKVLPAVQVLLGGGTVGDGVGRAAEKVLKVPTKRAPEVLRVVLDDYQEQAATGETFHSYYDRKGKDHFYQLLKPLSDLASLQDEDYVDWGHAEIYNTAIGVGECAGVVIDLVATLILDAVEKLDLSRESLGVFHYADAIYHAYSSFVNAAKAMLLDKGVNSSTQIGVIREFSSQYADEFVYPGFVDFETLVMQINKEEPSPEFAERYVRLAGQFIEQVNAKREELLQL
ncbi:MAG TPA: nitrite reductase, partial [Sphingobacteriaceae bacterium]